MYRTGLEGTARGGASALRTKPRWEDHKKSSQKTTSHAGENLKNKQKNHNPPKTHARLHFMTPNSSAKSRKSGKTRHKSKWGGTGINTRRQSPGGCKPRLPMGESPETAIRRIVSKKWWDTGKIRGDRRGRDEKTEPRQKTGRQNRSKLSLHRAETKEGIKRPKMRGAVYQNERATGERNGRWGD